MSTLPLLSLTTRVPRSALPWRAPRTAHRRLLLVLTGWIVLSGGLPVAAQTGRGYDFAGDGKRPGPVQAEAWVAEPVAARAASGSPAAPAAPGLPVRSAAAKQAARANLEVADRLAAKKTVQAGNLTVAGADLARTARAVAAWLASGRAGGAFPFRLYRSQGEDGQGNVQFTGYFTPRLEVAATPDARFRFPLYRFPTGHPKPLPSREQIDDGKALASRSLEIAWADDLLEVYFLQVQGSGRLHFQDGSEKWIAFAGSNGIPYQSLGRMLVERGSIPADRISLRAIRAWMRAHPEDLALLNRNPSYVFFKEATTPPVGAAGIPVIPGASVAADPRYIPAGACLLAEVPLLDHHGALLGHEWRLLFAHDTGGAIKGPGHLDLYFGLGRAAGERAGDLHHYGRIWLVLAEKPPARK